LEACPRRACHNESSLEGFWEILFIIAWSCNTSTFQQWFWYLR
jgi:hypothetical protein